MTYEGGLAEVTTQRVDDNRIAVKMGRHRVFDIVDGMVVHKSSGNGDTVFAKLSDLKEMLDKQPQNFGATPK